MANWSNPTLTSTYTNFVTEVKDRDTDCATFLDGSTSTNLPTGAKRWNSTTNKFEKWSGTAWSDLAASYAISISGTATHLAAGAAGSMPYQSGAGATTFVGIGAANTVLTSNGSAPVWTANTGTGNVVRATSPTLTTPTFTTSATGPLLIGGSASTSSLTLRSTSGAGTTGADLIFQTGNNGATEGARLLNNGNFGIGTASPGQKCTVAGTIESTSGGFKFPDGTTQSTAASALSAVLQAVYPVGSIYLNATNSTNPATLLGFGTWSAFGAGRMPVGFNSGDSNFNAAEKTGGSANAVVVSHAHTATSTVTDPGHAHTISGYNSGGNGTYQPAGAGVAGSFQYTLGTGGASTGVSVATSVASTGASATNANLPPFITIFMWKRTA